MLKSKITKRKFYNKWLYKITLHMPGVGHLRSDYNTAIFRLRVLSGDQTGLIKLLKYLNDLDKDSWTKRIENLQIDLYVNTQELYDDISKTFSEWIVHRFEPGENLTLLTSSNRVVVNKLPYDRYRYKVFLLPHLLKKDLKKKQNLLSWIDAQNSKILITDTVKQWFMYTNWNWDRRYVYVEDEGTLLMLQLRANQVLGKVHEYIINDK